MKWYRILAIVVILSILLAVINVPTVLAQGGRCRLVSLRYYENGWLVTEWVWQCTGYTQPRQARWQRWH